MTTEAEIHVWIAGYPRDWNQLCQALMWQLANEFGTVVSTPPSAIDAYNAERAAGRIKSGTAPAGTFVYFDIGADGHVGFVMDDGRVFMATSHLIAEWTNRDAGYNTVSGYCGATGARYLGYSTRNGGNTVPFTADGAVVPPPNEEDDEMTAIRFGHRKQGGDEWMIVHPDFYVNETQRGYIVTTDKDRSIAWGRLYSTGSNSYHFDVSRDDYIEIQNAARQAYDAVQGAAAMTKE